MDINHPSNTPKLLRASDQIDKLRCLVKTSREATAETINDTVGKILEDRGLDQGPVVLPGKAAYTGANLGKPIIVDAEKRSSTSPIAEKDARHRQGGHIYLDSLLCFLAVLAFAVMILAWQVESHKTLSHALEVFR